MKRRAIIVGSGGQDGTLLTKLLEQKGYLVIGLRRGDLDILSAKLVSDFVLAWQPDEIYYLAAYHHSSQDQINENVTLFKRSMDTHLYGPVHFMDAIMNCSPKSKFFYASSSHVFGAPIEPIQNENTPLKPESIYAITKTSGMHACRYYREEKGLFVSIGILYNHESPLRGVSFVTRKISSAAAHAGRTGGGKLVLGDLNARIDWGYAPDYVDAMQRILNINLPGDFIIATGESHTVGEFAEIAFRYVGLDYRKFVSTDESVLSRFNPVRIGDSSLLRGLTGWAPSISFHDMVCRMVACEVVESP